MALACALFVAPPAWAQKSVVPDRTYGEGGSREIEVRTAEDGTKTTEVTVKDKNGTVREHHKHTEDPHKANAVSDTHEWWGADGKKTREAWIDFDSMGETIYWHEEGYENGSMNSGNIHRKNAQNQWEHLRWNNALSTWEPVDPKKESPEPPKHLPKGPAKPFGFWGWFDAPEEITSSLYLGGTVIIEDGANTFVTAGFDASYTHVVSSTWAPIVEVQWTRGADGGVTYTKLQVMGGVATRPHMRGRLYFAPHLVAGVALVEADYGESPNPNTAATSFSMAAGVDIGTRLTRSIDLQGRLDYNPVFSGGDVRHNVRLGAGLRFRF